MMQSIRKVAAVGVFLLIAAGAALATNFVDDNTALPGTKTDRVPPTNPSQQWTASDANTVIAALGDLRTVAQRDGINAKAYGAVGNGVIDDSVAINAAMTAAAATRSVDYGSIVFLPRGTYLIGSPITFPNGVGLRGEGPTATVIKLRSSFNSTSAIRNANQVGNQEFEFLESLQIDGNVSGGAVVSTALVDIGCPFINSYIRDVVIANSSSVGLHVFATSSPGAMGPFLIENVWVTSSVGHNVVIEEIAGNVGAPVGIVGVNLTSEHQGSGKSALVIKGAGNAAQWNFFNTHIELGQVGASAQTGITIDGVAHPLFDGVQLLTGSVPAITAGIAITSAIQNVGIQIRGVWNLNGISPVISDALNSVTLGSGNVPMYVTPDVVVTGGMRFRPGGSSAKGFAIQNSSGTDILWSTGTGTLTGASPSGAGLELLGDATNNRPLILQPSTANGAFGFLFPDTSHLRLRAFTGGNDLMQFGADGTVFHYGAPTFQSNATFQSKILTTGSVPTLSSCGTSPTVDTGSTSVDGEFTTGSAATTCTITFASAWPAKPHCQVTGNGVTGPTYTTSTTAITMTVDVASTIYRYHCGGH